MWVLRAAFATDDGISFMNRHFGDAKYFDVYDIDGSSMRFVKRITNTIEEAETIHGDPVKAGGITGLLQKEQVNTVVAYVFGPNIKRIKKHFVCVRMDDTTIEDAGLRMRKYFETIQKEWEQGEHRNVLTLLLKQERVEE